MRSKNLNEGLIEQIIHMIDSWTGKLTWDALIKEIKERTSNTYTRQALDRHQRIAEAYKVRKSYLSQSNGKKQRVSESYSPAEVQVLLERYKRIEAENMRLKKENARLLIQFDIWAYNAHTRGLDERFLNRPLINTDRDVTRN